MKTITNQLIRWIACVLIPVAGLAFTIFLFVILVCGTIHALVAKGLSNLIDWAIGKMYINAPTLHEESGRVLIQQSA